MKEISPALTTLKPQICNEMRFRRAKRRYFFIQHIINLLNMLLLARITLKDLNKGHGGEHNEMGQVGLLCFKNKRLFAHTKFMKTAIIVLPHSTMGSKKIDTYLLGCTVIKFWEMAKL